VVDARITVTVAKTGGLGRQLDDGVVDDLMLLEGDSVVLVDCLSANNWQWDIDEILRHNNQITNTHSKAACQ